MKEEKNNDIFLRPRFQMDLDIDIQKLNNNFKLRLKKDNCKYPSRISENHFFIDVPENEAHFWSPQLSIEIEESKNNTSILKGLFGPKPKVWTFFMFLHFAGAIIFIISLVMLYVKWSLKENTVFSLIIMIFTPIIWSSLYFLGRLGRSKGKDQMEELHGFLMKIIAEN